MYVTPVFLFMQELNKRVIEKKNVDDPAMNVILFNFKMADLFTGWPKGIVWAKFIGFYIMFTCGYILVELNKH